MGSSSSKFRKHLSNGDEVAALNLYNSHQDLRKGLDPNSSYGDAHQNETPLHYAARHGMKSLLRIFLQELGGNPNKTNGQHQTCLHCACMEKACHAQYIPVQRRRMECLMLLLNWRGAQLMDGQEEQIDLSAQDQELNTALHYAAESGLKKCVEILVQQGAPLFSENKEQLTPCDLAEKNEHSEIAMYLESKMVFSDSTAQEEVMELPTLVDLEEYSGLKAQDLQEAKDQLLVETADMLNIPLFTADALLRNHEWSREVLLEAWMLDPLACCHKSGVTPPPGLFNDKPQVQECLASPTPKVKVHADTVCDICTQAFPVEDEVVHLTCEHQFCKTCWQEYLNIKIQEGDAHNITCPGFTCDKLVPVDTIEMLVSREMARRYLQFDIKAFVESNPSMKWCPHPGCGRAVRLPETESPASQRHLPVDHSRSVDCGRNHFFCWDCSGEAHEPCSCANWNCWFQKISEIQPETLGMTERETESAANCLWLVTNSKPCPNCKSPIQKNEGCNHMKCSKCKHDFCWVCLDPWKRHNSATGGYFKCNRYEVSKAVQESTQQAQDEAEEKNRKMQELNRFVHYYTRFKNHENSYKLEEPLISSAKNKMMKLAEAVTDPGTANLETKFVEDAVEQLLRARRVLRCSYAYGYYLDGPGYKKVVFEFMQTELEECTEILSQMVNRLYLRTPRRRIIEQAYIVKRKRQEFLAAIGKGLVPPETPPGLRKHRRRKYSLDFDDEELRSAILASIQDVDTTNPWIKDASGRHTNVSAILDWPDSDDSDSDVKLISAGTCARAGCNRKRVKNPRTGEWHEFCSWQCKNSSDEEPANAEPVEEAILDEQMDLLRALEMSRIQFLRDQGIIADPESAAAKGSSPEHGGAPSHGQASIQNESKTRTPKRSAPQSERKSRTPMEELDLELQRVLEISAIHPEELDMGPGKAGAEFLRRHQETKSPTVHREPSRDGEPFPPTPCASSTAPDVVPMTTGPPGQNLDLPPPLESQDRSKSKSWQTQGMELFLKKYLSSELRPLEASQEPDIMEFASNIVKRKGPVGLATPTHQQRDSQTGPSSSSLALNAEEETTSGDSIDLQGVKEQGGSKGEAFGVIKELCVSNINVDPGDKTLGFHVKSQNLRAVALTPVSRDSSCPSLPSEGNDDDHRCVPGAWGDSNTWTVGAGPGESDDLSVQEYRDMSLQDMSDNLQRISEEMTFGLSLKTKRNSCSDSELVGFVPPGGDCVCTSVGFYGDDPKLDLGSDNDTEGKPWEENLIPKQWSEHFQGSSVDGMGRDWEDGTESIGKDVVGRNDIEDEVHVAWRVNVEDGTVQTVIADDGTVLEKDLQDRSFQEINDNVRALEKVCLEDRTVEGVSLGEGTAHGMCAEAGTTEKDCSDNETLDTPPADCEYEMDIDNTLPTSCIKLLLEPSRIHSQGSEDHQDLIGAIAPPQGTDRDSAPVDPVMMDMSVESGYAHYKHGRTDRRSKDKTTPMDSSLI